MSETTPDVSSTLHLKDPPPDSVGEVGSGDAALRSEALRAEDLLPVMYHELRALAKARLRGASASHTLQPTALVHEAYLRITKGDSGTAWNSPGHFFGAAAEAMRQVLVDHARAKGARKRGGDRRRVGLDEVVAAAEQSNDDVLVVSEAVDALEQEDPTLATILKLRYFVGLGREEAAAALDIPLRTFDRRWRYIVARIKELDDAGGDRECSEHGGAGEPIG
ncbi:MAG: ECF-type sigma factor [Phycisphaerales bacterium]